MKKKILITSIEMSIVHRLKIILAISRKFNAGEIGNRDTMQITVEKYFLQGEGSLK